MLAYDFTKTESDNLSLQQQVRRLASASSLKCPAATKESTATESGGFDMLLTAAASAAAFQSPIQTKQYSATAIPNSIAVDPTITDALSPLSDGTNKRSKKRTTEALLPGQKRIRRSPSQLVQEKINKQIKKD